jgi:uncharacterized membrane protein YsdA (DUF1294 family)
MAIRRQRKLSSLRLNKRRGNRRIAPTLNLVVCELLSGRNGSAVAFRISLAARIPCHLVKKVPREKYGTRRHSSLRLNKRRGNRRIAPTSNLVVCELLSGGNGNAVAFRIPLAARIPCHLVKKVSREKYGTRRHSSLRLNKRRGNRRIAPTLNLVVCELLSGGNGSAVAFRIPLAARIPCHLVKKVPREKYGMRWHSSLRLNKRRGNRRIAPTSNLGASNDL